MSSFTQAFITQLDNFNQELMELFPEDTELKTFHRSRRMLQQHNPKLILEMFYEHVTLIYKDLILVENDEAIMRQSAVDIENKYNSGMHLIDKLRGYWGVISQESKSAVWKYLKLLVLLSEKAMLRP